MNRENIFKAHRRHLYQLLSNELGWSQILVAVIYGLVQLIVNYLLLLMNEHQYNPMLGFAFIALSFGAIYLFIRWLTLRSVNKSMSLS
jgi:hypothetical protein